MFKFFHLIASGHIEFSAFVRSWLLKFENKKAYTLLINLIYLGFNSLALAVPFSVLRLLLIALEGKLTSSYEDNSYWVFVLFFSGIQILLILALRNRSNKTYPEAIMRLYWLLELIQLRSYFLRFFLVSYLLFAVTLIIFQLLLYPFEPDFLGLFLVFFLSILIAVFSRYYIPKKGLKRAIYRFYIHLIICLLSIIVGCISIMLKNGITEIGLGTIGLIILGLNSFIQLIQRIQEINKDYHEEHDNYLNRKLEVLDQKHGASRQIRKFAILKERIEVLKKEKKLTEFFIQAALVMMVGIIGIIYFPKLSAFLDNQNLDALSILEKYPIPERVKDLLFTIVLCLIPIGITIYFIKRKPKNFGEYLLFGGRLLFSISLPLIFSPKLYSNVPNETLLYKIGMWVFATSFFVMLIIEILYRIGNYISSKRSQPS